MGDVPKDGYLETALGVSNYFELIEVEQWLEVNNSGL